VWPTPSRHGKKGNHAQKVRVDHVLSERAAMPQKGLCSRELGPFGFFHTPPLRFVPRILPAFLQTIFTALISAMGLRLARGQDVDSDAAGLIYGALSYFGPFAIM